MADVFARRGRQEIRHHRHLSGYVGDDISGCDSASSEEVYDSGEELALDLEVEASPPQRENGLDPSAGGDVEASFFSDYAAQVRPAAPAAPLVSSPPVLTGDHNVRHFYDAAPLANPRENGEEILLSNDGDGFYDAEYASSLQGRRATPSPSPPPAALANWREDGALRSYSHRSGRAGSWLDPLGSPSPPLVDTDDDKGLSREALYAPHGLSDSPHRATDASRSAPHSDTPLSHGGPPSVKLREGTAAPSREPNTGSPVHPAVRTASGRAPQGFTTARSAAASALPRNDARRQVHESTASGAGDVPASPHPSSSSPPRSHVRDVYASVSPDRMGDGVVSPPPRKPTATTARDGVQDVTPTLVLAQVPGLCPLLATAATGIGAVQQRVVRELAPRGVPLLLRCTGHAKTPMRTIVLRDASESCNGGEDSEGEEETVNGGPHTTAYRETGSMSDLITSSSPASPATSTNIKGKVESAHFTPERAAKPRQRAARSRSPFVSLVTGGHPGGIEMSEVHHPNDASSASRASSSSASLLCAVASAPPELVDFSVHSEALGRCAQEDSLVFCGYSVESFPISPRVIGGARDDTVSKSRTDGETQHQPRPSAAPCRAHCSTAASRLTAHSYIQSSSKENVSYPGFVGRRRASNETGRGAAQQKERGDVVLNSEEDDRAHPWPSRELMYPNPVAERLDVSPEVALPRGRPQLFNIHTMIDSVEETTVGPGLSVTAAATVAGFRHGYGSQPNPATAAAPHHAADVSSDYSSASLSATGVKHDQLQRRQQQRAAVRQLLARQTDPQFSSRSRSQRRSLSDCAKHGGAAPRPHTSATYMARQEELRAQRVAAEAEALRLGLALDVCVAVRPFGRDLLLMFLLLVEESKTALQRRGDVSRTRDCSCDRFIDPVVCGESRVSYDTCAEAVNCVLERHGVSWVRATRELCQRVVRWCHHHVRNPTSSAISSASSAEASFVEYTTFVSCVMEFAAQYPGQTS